MSLKKLLIVLLAVGLVAVGFIYSGFYNVAADEPHTGIVSTVLETVRVRSIAARADSASVPDLSDPEQIRSGAGNYDAMCAQCHLAPGMAETELHRGLLPTPPNLAEHRIGDPAKAFWVIKHGIKFTGMPAWGESMGDDYIWGLVALINRLPELDASQYQALVAASDGHQHGGSETPHEMGDGQAGHRHAGGHAEEPRPAQANDEEASAVTPSAKPASSLHSHEGGDRHAHEH